MELTEFFSFMAPGYAFMPAYRNRMWDGKIRIFNGRNNTLPSGLLHHLAEFAKSRSYDLKCPGLLIPGTYASYECAMPKGPLTYNGKLIEPRDYQVEAIARGMRDHQALLVSPTGSGKSLIIYLLIRWFLGCSSGITDKTMASKIIVVVPTTALCHQMYKDFAEYSANDKNFSSKDRSNIIMSGYSKNPTNKHLLITMENDYTRMLRPNEIVNTKNGEKFARDLTLKDELV